METVTVVKTAGMSIGGAGVVGATGYGAYTLVQPKTVREQLEWNGKTVLDTSGTTNDSVWTILIGKYPSDTSQPKLSGLASFESGDDENAKKNKIKAECEKELNAKLAEDNSEAKLKAAEAWCTAESENAKAS